MAETLDVSYGGFYRLRSAIASVVSAEFGKILWRIVRERIRSAAMPVFLFAPSANFVYTSSAYHLHIKDRSEALKFPDSLLLMLHTFLISAIL